MHVLYLIDSLIAAGAETSLASLAPELMSRGVRLEVAYLRERPGVAGELRRAGVPLFSLADRSGRARWAWAVAQLVRQQQPDLVHTTLFEADLAGRLAGLTSRVPLVTTLANIAYGPEQLAGSGLRRWKVRATQVADCLTAPRVTRFHAITQAVAHTMGRRLRLPPERIEVVPRGRDGHRLGVRSDDRREQARLGLGLGPDQAMVLAAARQEHQKGLDVLVEAWPMVAARVAGAQLVIAGRPGNQTPLLAARTAELGLAHQVRFLGARPDVHELLCGTDVFVLPSRWEGLGSVLLEAMALEAPMVASDLPSVREVVGGETCARLVPPGDPVILAETIVAALADPAGNRRRAADARNRFLEHFTIDRVAEGMMGLYGRALGG